MPLNTKTVEFKVPLGVMVRCIQTGLIGRTASSCERLNGCIQYAVQPMMEKDDKEMPKGWHLDEAQLEPLDKKEKFKPWKHTYTFNTGDKVKGKLVDFTGHITTRLLDVNKCERYIVLLPKLDEKGKEVIMECFPQELSFVNEGINKKEEPVKRARTGCSPIQMNQRHK